MPTRKQSIGETDESRNLRLASKEKRGGMLVKIRGFPGRVSTQRSKFTLQPCASATVRSAVGQ